MHYTGLDPELHYLSQGYAILRVAELKRICTGLPQNCYVTVTNYYEIGNEWKPVGAWKT